MKTPIFIILTVIFLCFSPTQLPFNKNHLTVSSNTYYEEYIYIDKELWHLVYSEDGSLIFKERIFE